jgi:hypothetical protein
MCDILCDLKKVKYVIFYVKKYQICYILCDLVPKNGVDLDLSRRAAYYTQMLSAWRSRSQYNYPF